MVLPGPVRADHDPALVLVRGPVDVPQQQRRLAPYRHATQLEHLVRHCPSSRRPLRRAERPPRPNLCHASRSLTRYRMSARGWSHCARRTVPCGEMNQPTLLITLTGRDRPGVTSRLFSALARFPLSVVDIEQVTIRGRLVLGVLVACDEPPDLTAIYRAVTEPGGRPRARGGDHHRVGRAGRSRAGHGADPRQAARHRARQPAAAGRGRRRRGPDRGERRQHRPHHPAGQRSGDLRRAGRLGGRARLAAGRAGPGGRGQRRGRRGAARRACTGGRCG